jgi:hypothetical protein
LLHQPELKEFCGFLLSSELFSEKTYRLFLGLACQPPNIRLALNLRSLAGCFGHKEVKRIREDGVSPDERAALDELDSPYVPERLREVGHGLLHMHSRWLCAQAVRRVVGEAHFHARKFLGSVSLDDVLGE